MERPVLFYDDASPPVRSCLMLIKMLEIDIEYKLVDLFKGEHLQEDFLKINPMHTVPTLIDGDLILTDSHAILLYFYEKYGKLEDKVKSDLVPEESNNRFKMMNMMFFEASLLFRRDSDLMSDIVRKGFDNANLPYYERKIHEAYTIMETILKNHKYMSGDQLTLADISILTTLSTVDLVFPVTDKSCRKWPLLHDWFERMKNLPEYEINLKGLQKLQLAMESFGNFKFVNLIHNSNNQASL